MQAVAQWCVSRFLVAVFLSVQQLLTLLQDLVSYQVDQPLPNFKVARITEPTGTSIQMPDEPNR